MSALVPAVLFPQSGVLETSRRAFPKSGHEGREVIEMAEIPEMGVLLQFPRIRGVAYYG